MATKLKKYKSYQMKWKVVAVIILIICAMANFFCGVVGATITKTWSRDVIDVESFYDTNEFNYTFSTVLNDVILAEVFYQNEQRIQDGLLIDRESMITDFKRYYGIMDGIITENTEINDTYDGLIVHGKIPESLIDNFEEYNDLVQNRLPLYRKMYIQNQLDAYKHCVRNIEMYNNFLYYVEDGNGKLIGGNSTRGEMSTISRTVVLSSGFMSDNLGDYFFDYTNYYLEQSDYKIYAGIRDPLLPQDVFYELGQEFRFAKASLPILLGVFTVSTLLFFACLVYLVRVTGQVEKKGEIQSTAVDRIYNEIHFLLVAVFFFAGGITAFSLVEIILIGTAPFWSYIFVTLLGLIYLSAVGVGLSYVLSVARQIKGRKFFRNTWISATIRRVSALFTGKTFRGWMIFIMLCYGLGNCVLMGASMVAFQMNYIEVSVVLGVILLLFNGFCIFLFLRALRSLKRIMISARETSKGNLAYQLNLAEISPSFLNFAEDIANIQDGLKNSVEDAVKGERMKTELITNVSHDLKTPLTSIISYAYLLRNEKLENATAAQYVEVLYDKSYRLKQLIEDLIEASKASSGNLTVTKMRIDYRQLTMQAIGELEEKIEAAGLEFKISCPEPVMIDADGRHLWRILENLVSNTVKYSMPDSRVYIDIFKAEESGILVMKNISATPIDFDETRLSDRFVRGDSSRTTEGSGLGLSIAQSLAEVQGGTFGIQVDGDLFKAIVSMPLWEGQEEEEEIEEDIYVDEKEAEEEEGKGDTNKI